MNQNVLYDIKSGIQLCIPLINIDLTYESKRIIRYKKRNTALYLFDKSISFKVFASNSNFVIPISFKHDGVNL